MRKKPTGFTLVEVLVSLVLLALSMGAVIDTISTQSFQMINLRDRFHANRIAMHVVGNYYLNNTWPKLGETEQTIDIGKASWEWRALVLPTSDKKLRRIEILVSPDDTRNNIKGKLVFFVSNPKVK